MKRRSVAATISTGLTIEQVIESDHFKAAVKKIAHSMYLDRRIAITTKERDRPADRQWGYKFGVDGLMNTEEARQWLGGVSRRTLGRRMAQGKIRRGFNGHKVVLCRRSVIEHANSLEQ